MQNIIIDKPYHFVPPRDSRFWPLALRAFLSLFLKKKHGVVRCEMVGAEHLLRSIDAGHGVLITPNHCRPCDPMVLEHLPRRIAQPHYTMASWHLFMQSPFQSWLLPRLNVFSVYREGMDGASVKKAISILKEAQGPLIIFPEGLISRSNDLVRYMNEGPAFIALSAAKQRLKQDPAKKVVIHPVAIRYFFDGDLMAVVAPVLAEIESRLTWTPEPQLPLMQRIRRIGQALLDLKEREYLGRPQEGAINHRLSALIDHILGPLESEWRVPKNGQDVPTRVRALRSTILPQMADGQVTELERARRWKQLADLYLAQQLSLYPPDYLASRPTPERVLETVERFEEDLTDHVRVHSPIRARVMVDEAIEIDPNQGLSPASLTDRIRQRLEAMLAQSGESSKLLGDLGE